MIRNETRNHWIETACDIKRKETKRKRAQLKAEIELHKEQKAQGLIPLCVPNDASIISRCDWDGNCTYFHKGEYYEVPNE